MEHSELVLRLLKEVASARAAIAAGYLHLWGPGERLSRDRRGASREMTPNAELTASRDLPTSPDEV